MECNKEDANKAKQVAEKKMDKKDFAGAKKFALKAQRLNPDIENISQIITTCDVHLAAAVNIENTNLKDWYAILQVEPTDDEASIKKQFRKFALVLHPDKNSFTGAADAFKLIGEAQRVLLDKVKRTLYDNKRKAAIASTPAIAPTAAKTPANTFADAAAAVFFRPATFTPNFATTSAAASSAAGPFSIPAATSAPCNNSDMKTFWTICSNCRVKYKYYIATLNKRIKCQSCKEPFTCVAIVSPRSKSKSAGPHSPSLTSRKNVVTEKNIQDSPLKSQSNRVFGEKNVTVGPTKEPKSDAEKHGRRSSNMGFEGEGENYGRSNFAKRKLDTENVRPSKKVKGNEYSGFPDPSAVRDSDIEVTLEPKIKPGLTNEMPADDNSTDSFEYPDPDFSNFDKDRSVDKLAVGQIWAVYDTFDAMPRFFTKIHEIISPGSTIKMTWLEPDPDNVDEIRWAKEGLPVSCGKFKFGESDSTDDHQTFSHFICWDRGRKRENLYVYPRKGETWAVFKDWSIKWYANRDSSKKKFEYEFVEILSEYDDVAGVSVAYLVKIKDFACLFCRKEPARVLISPKEMYRFSHRVPSFKMTGKEREDVPEGSFELDPASLPTDLVGVSVPEYVDLTESPTGSIHGSPDSLTKSQKEDIKKEGIKKEDIKKEDISKSSADSPKKDEDISSSPADPVKSFTSVKNEEDILNSPAESPKSTRQENAGASTSAEPLTKSTSEVGYEIPDPEFYNFDTDKVIEKIFLGDIWAFYSDEDSMPKYYGLIKNITHLPELIIEIKWLIPCAPPRDLIKFHEKEMLITCGKFKLQKKSKLDKYDSVESFSHRVRVSTPSRDIYVILPKQGEVWAMYKNWSAELACADLEDCEYEIAEIAEENEASITISMLEVVKDHKSIYRPQQLTKIIPRAELYRFSHQLPAFKLTKEIGGQFEGLWELDPAAIPVLLLCSSS